MNDLQIILILLLVVSFAATAFWGVFLMRLARSMRMSISMQEGRDVREPDGGWPKVGIVVPAHDEEAMIERCVRSIVAQDYPALQAVFVLDRCTDRTEQIIHEIAGDDERVQVLHVEDCPDDWAGKCNAARVGAEHLLAGDARMLVFTDADALFEPELVRSAVAIALRERSGLLSVLSTLSNDRWDEWFIQPVASLNLMRMHPTDRVNRARNPHAFANGQFMLFDRDCYESLGGHGCVRNDLLEDIALARAVVSQGDRAIIVNADSMLQVSMYDSLTSLLEGWKRIYIEVARRRPRRLLAWSIRVLSAGLLVPSAQVATLVIGSILGARGDTTGLVLALCAVGSGLLLQAISLAWYYRVAGAPVMGVLGFPVGCLLVARSMFEGCRDLALGRPIRWGGREYVLKPD